MAKWVGFLVLVTVLVGCARLDQFMFNADNTIVEYRFDEYEGEVDFILGADYDIPDTRMHLFTLAAAPDVQVWAVYIGDTATIDTDTVIMYCHGNRDHMDFYWPRAKLLANTGGNQRYGVLMIDYRGFGLSVGEPTEASLTHDVNLGLEWLKARGLSGDRLCMYGFSLGSAPATDLCADEMALAPGWLILENPFASTDVLVADASVINLPGSFVTNADYDNAEQIQKVDQPFLWLHGQADDFLQISTHGEVVFKNYDGAFGQAVRVPAAGHGTLPQTMGFDQYLETLEVFLTR